MIVECKGRGKARGAKWGGKGGKRKKGRGEENLWEEGEIKEGYNVAQEKKGPERLVQH